MKGTAAEERAAIVKWLRGQAADGRILPPSLRTGKVVLEDALDLVAEHIENGLHEAQSGEEQ